VVDDDCTVYLTGEGLTCSDVVRVTAGAAFDVAPFTRTRLESARSLVESIAGRRNVYGRTTGVGANRHEVVDASAAHDHGLRLLRSHAGGTGPALSPDHARATMVIRLNQLLAGGSGIHSRVTEGLAAALRSGAVPLLHRYGAIGTADLAPLAQLALTLADERPWAHGPAADPTDAVPSPVQFDAGDALAFISSNAATLAESVLAHHELAILLDVTPVVAALSYLALGGSREALAGVVHDARAHVGQVEAARRLRELLGPGDPSVAPRRLQDPFGLRAFPQVQGPAIEALRGLGEVLRVEINARAENPLVSEEAGDVLHHGHFHTAYVTSALDRLRQTVHQAAQLSAARLANLMEPELTQLPAFLHAGPAGSSGVMILEYVAQDALAELRHAAMPAVGEAVISRGLEDHASFSTQAARRATTVADTFRVVLSCELIAAVRAVRMSEQELPPSPAAAAFTKAAAALSDDHNDRSLSDDLEQAGRLLADLVEEDAAG
jgi:histidine ammonia-lyase